MTEHTDADSDGVQKGPVIEWVESHGWTKADVELLVSILTLVSLGILISQRYQKVVE